MGIVGGGARGDQGVARGGTLGGGGKRATHAERMIQGKWRGSVMSGKVMRTNCIPCQEGT